MNQGRKMKKTKKKYKPQIKFTKIIKLGIFLAIVLIFYLAFKNFFSQTIYKGTLPCADCPGIEATLTFFNNGTYSQIYLYEERNTSFEEKGTWLKIPWKKDTKKTVYQLTSSTGVKTYYLISDDAIISLDSGMNELPPPYNAPLRAQ